MGTNSEIGNLQLQQDKISYLRCSEVEIDKVYQAFKIGFSDYIVKMEISKEDFISRFFGPEGNSLEHSFIALYENNPVGVILGGIKVYENIKTIRCGALAISPDFRGKGISHKLFELHKEEAIKNGCKQLFLEVIVGNDRAINFYKKLGYEKVYDLSYFSLPDLTDLNNNLSTSNVVVKSIEISEFQKTIQKWDYHINWQNDIDYLSKTPTNVYYGAYIDNEIVGCIAANPSGKVSFIMVDQNQRIKGIGRFLLNTVIKELDLSKMSISFPNNSLLEGFLNHLGFKKDSISQYEMYLSL
jgi:ribosomal protein S18 acetylase RimI-like enzyme